MADSPNSTILSRRALMASAPAVALAALPVAAVASAPVVSPHERMDALIKELQLVVQEIYPNIDSWLVSSDKNAFPINETRCPFTIAAFDHPGSDRRPVPKVSVRKPRVQS